MSPAPAAVPGAWEVHYAFPERVFWSETQPPDAEGASNRGAQHTAGRTAAHPGARHYAGLFAPRSTVNPRLQHGPSSAYIFQKKKKKNRSKGPTETFASLGCGLTDSKSPDGDQQRSHMSWPCRERWSERRALESADPGLSQAQLLHRCATLHKFLNFSVPQFPPGGGSSRGHDLGLTWELDH